MSKRRERTCREIVYPRQGCLPASYVRIFPLVPPLRPFLFLPSAQLVVVMDRLVRPAGGRLESERASERERELNATRSNVRRRRKRREGKQRGERREMRFLRENGRTYGRRRIADQSILLVTKWRFKMASHAPPILCRPTCRNRRLLAERPKALQDGERQRQRQTVKLAGVGKGKCFMESPPPAALPATSFRESFRLQHLQLGC